MCNVLSLLMASAIKKVPEDVTAAVLAICHVVLLDHLPLTEPLSCWGEAGWLGWLTEMIR